VGAREKGGLDKLRSGLGGTRQNRSEAGLGGTRTEVDDLGDCIKTDIGLGQQGVPGLR